MSFKRGLFRIAQRLVLQPVARQMRGMTLGTRTAILDDQGRVLLVRHSYAPGWLLPGGGVERGETLDQSARREILEEAGVVATGPLTLHGVFNNDEHFPGDHVACFTLRDFERKAWKPSLEIVAAEFFALDALPEGTTGGTRRRLAEISGQQAPAPRW